MVDVVYSSAGRSAGSRYEKYTSIWNPAIYFTIIWVSLNRPFFKYCDTSRNRMNASQAKIFGKLYCNVGCCQNPRESEDLVTLHQFKFTDFTAIQSVDFS